MDISNCLEKSEIVNIIYSSSRKQCRDVAETVNKTIQCIVIETDSSESSKEYKVPSDLDSLSAESCDSDDRNCKMNKRAIDGLVAYRLAFNPKNMMRSSKDGRSWGTWVTSNRKGFDRKRRTARCNGGYKCENLKCSFLTVYKVNKLQFESDGNGIKSCSCCGEQATKVHCNSQKIWEFEKNEEYVTVYHLGNHNCEAKKTVELNKESLKRKFKTNSKTTPKQAAGDITVEALENEYMSWEDVQDVVDSVTDNEKVKYCKKKTERESHPHGHSFEAVGQLRSRLIK